jgi:hypothetical protein
MLLMQVARSNYRGGGGWMPPDDEETKKKKRRRAIIAAVVATLFGIGVGCYLAYSYHESAERLKFMYAPQQTRA